MTRLRRRRCHANRTFRQSSEYGLTSSVTRDPSIFCSFFVSSVLYLFRRALFLLGCTARLWRFGAFLLRSGGDWGRGGRGWPLPASRAVLGPTVHLGALRCRRSTGNKVPRTTWFLWLSESASQRRYLGTQSPGANLTGNVKWDTAACRPPRCCTRPPSELNRLT